MSTIEVMGEFARVVEDASALPLDQQESLVAILRSRLVEQKREALAVQIQRARDESAQGLDRVVTVDDIMREASE